MENYYVVEVEQSEGNFFRQITQAQVEAILASDDGDKVREIIVDEGQEIAIRYMGEVDLYFGYPEQWKDEVKQEWQEAFAD